jgi:hypothetical protein
MNNQNSKIKIIILLFTVVVVVLLGLEYTGNLNNTIKYDSENSAGVASLAPGSKGVELINLRATSTASTTQANKLPDVVHLKTPEVVRAMYMTSCIASGKNLRAPLLGIIDRTSINSVVIDVKDYTGYLSVNFGDKNYPIGGKSCLVSDMHQFLSELGNKGIYRIARVAVMQDPYYAAKNPAQAVLRKDNGKVWVDKKGLAFVDPGSEEFWKYNRDIAYKAYEAGFDEVNFDYVRYPTDGNIGNMSFKLTGTSTKADMMRKFYIYMGKAMKDKNIPSSVDLFGMTTTATGDLGIGQILEDALINFDYIAPMVYPSHYPAGFNGWKNPNMFPGPLTEYVMGESVRRAKVMGLPVSKLRTWVQDFDYGKDYTKADIQAIIKASEKVGVPSYMVWDPSNKYTESAYGIKEIEKIVDTATSSTSN